MRTYRVTEWGRILYQSTEGETVLPRQDAERLCAASERFARASGWAAEDILSYGRLGLQAKQTVGVLQVRDCRLEILPKIDSGDDAMARRTLIGMLASVHDFTISIGTQASIEEQSRDVIEGLIAFFLVSLDREVRRGLPRKYSAHENDLKHLRGSLDTRRQFTVLAAAPDRLACRYDELTADTPMSRVLKSACRYLCRISGDPANQRKARDLLNAFDGVGDLDPARAVRECDIILDRTNTAYRALLDQALMFLRYRWQSIYSGDSNGFALLFQMNILFEAFIGKCALRLQSRLNCDVRLQGPHSFALHTDTGTRHFKTKPDICVEFEGGKARTIIDTKWKRLAHADRGAPWGISNSDIYQMLTYAEVYDAGRVVLLYPHPAQLGIAPGIVDRFYSRDRKCVVEVATIDLNVLNTVNEQLAAILETHTADMMIGQRGC